MIEWLIWKIIFSIEIFFEKSFSICKFFSNLIHCFSKVWIWFKNNEIECWGRDSLISKNDNLISSFTVFRLTLRISAIFRASNFFSKYNSFTFFLRSSYCFFVYGPPFFFKLIFYIQHTSLRELIFYVDKKLSNN